MNTAILVVTIVFAMVITVKETWSALVSIVEKLMLFVTTMIITIVCSSSGIVVILMVPGNNNDSCSDVSCE